MKFLAAIDPTIGAIFGGITPPDAMDIGGSNPADSLGKFIAFFINMFILVAGMALLLFLLMGALNWITSGGDKEKIQKAQSRITNAVIGMLLIFVVLAVFNLLVGNILGIIVPIDGGGFKIKLPTL